MLKPTRVALITAVAVLVCPAVACADVLVPTAMVAYPSLIVMLVPIMAIEALIIGMRLHLGTKQALKVSVISNIVSTVVGVPIAGLLALLLPGHLGFVGSGISYALGVMVAVALFLLASWLIEYQVAWRMLREIDRGSVNIAALLANLASYALFTLVLFVWPV